MKYRPEIDGLRAVAVIPVIFYHAGIQLFSGGFVGVDVFFVISGYLITSIIIADLEVGAFSIVKFYERRARRILPALFFVLAVCFPVAWGLLIPNYFMDFAVSVAGVVTFTFNFMAAKRVGYFDTAADLQPLLHTWSLAVEEQFYLFFPLLLVILWRLGKPVVISALIIIATISVYQMQWIYTGPQESSRAYYLLVTRGWELLAGAFIAFWFARNNGVKGSQFLSITGLGLLVYAIFFFDKQTPFPSFYTFIPVVGTVMVIIGTSAKTLPYRFLSNRFVVGAGLISYSAYLWHFPIFVFARHVELSEPSAPVMFALTALSIVLAYFSWRFVEAPFRAQGGLSRRFVFGSAGALSAIYILLGTVIYYSDGFDSRWSVEKREMLSYLKYPFQKIYREGTCFLQPQSTAEQFSDECRSAQNHRATLVWGDSHAAALSYGVRSQIDNVAQYTAAACPPFVDLDENWYLNSNCGKIAEFVQNEISTEKPYRVILNAYWERGFNSPVQLYPRYEA